jgi:protein-S-isoprenylcysteine O-methyltransferase Ste14
MTESFQKPIGAPPTIFGIALLLGIVVDLISSAPISPSILRFPFGAVGIAGGIWLIRKSMIAINEGNTTYDPYAPSTNLVTSGIYRQIRNPGYLGLAVIQLGFACLLNSRWIIGTLAAAFLITHFFVVLREEDKLRRTFGESYDAYIASSRRWL